MSVAGQLQKILISVERLFSMFLFHHLSISFD
jgi:hypothetical protein